MQIVHLVLVAAVVAVVARAAGIKHLPRSEVVVSVNDRVILVLWF